MKKQIKEWCDFCENKTTINEYNPITLFMDFGNGNLYRDDLKEIFKYFPNNEILIEITFDYLNNNLYKNREATIQDKQKLLDLFELDLNEKKKIISLIENKDLLLYIESIRFEFVEDMNLFKSTKQSTFQNELESELNDFFIDYCMGEDKINYALRESFYGLTSDCYMVWYLLKPLLNTNFNFDYYYKFKKLGGSYLFLDKQVLLSF